MTKILNFEEAYKSLSKTSQENVKKLVQELYESDKKRALRKELENRRNEIKQGEKISSEMFWDK